MGLNRFRKSNEMGTQEDERLQVSKSKPFSISPFSFRNMKECTHFTPRPETKAHRDSETGCSLRVGGLSTMAAEILSQARRCLFWTSRQMASLLGNALSWKAQGFPQKARLFNSQEFIMLSSLITTLQPLRVSKLAFLSSDASTNIHLQLSCRGLGPLMTGDCDFVVRVDQRRPYFREPLEPRAACQKFMHYWPSNTTTTPPFG